MVVLAPEADLVTRLDPEFVSQLLGNDDLALRPDTMSHTDEYNSIGSAARLPSSTGSVTLQVPGPVGMQTFWSLTEGTIRILSDKGGCCGFHNTVGHQGLEP